jgi:hypothetical protein
MALKLWRRCHDELTAAIGEIAEVDRTGTFFFAMSAIAHGLRLRHVGESAARITEAFERYAIAGFVNVFSFPAGTADATVRRAFMGGYQKVGLSYSHRFDEILADWRNADVGQMIAIWARDIATSALLKQFDPRADPERTRRVIEILLEDVWMAALNDVRQIEEAAIAAAGDALWNLALDAPDGWIANSGASYEFYDPARPEYRVWVTVQDPLADYDGTDPEVVGRDLAGIAGARQGVSVSLGADRALVSYRTSEDESGIAKDDRHWFLLERDGGRLRRALFTLSVLAERAVPPATDELAALWAERIAGARFVVRH